MGTSINTIQGAKLLLSIFLLLLSMSQADALAARYVCKPCGLPCDAKYSDRPGTCPACGMPLVREEEANAAAAEAEPAKKVAILIFDGVEIIDYTGPYEMFGAANFDVYTVAKTKDAVTTAMGMTVLPKYSFDDVPLPDVLVVPGGGVTATQNDSTTLRWIKDETTRIRQTMSVCNGAFILASAGLLDGLSATTTNGNIPRLRKLFPKITVVNDKRYVDNGKVITTAGLSAGIDGALHVIEKLMGRGYAQQVALLEEYDWRPRAAFARAALADRLIPIVNLGTDYGKWEIVTTAGGTDHWERVLRGTSDKSLRDITEYFEGAYTTSGKWKKESTGSNGTSKWTLQGDDGKPWNGMMTIQETPARSRQYTVTVKIAKGG